MLWFVKKERKVNIKSYLLKFWNLWPPFLFAGIKIVKRTTDYRHIVVKLKLRFWNANYIGTQYGGSIYSMADPFYMIMLSKNLGHQFSVIDKSAQIRYLKLGKTDLTATFILTDEELDSIRKTTEELGKFDWIRKIEIKDAFGDTVAEVEKTISIKRK